MTSDFPFFGVNNHGRIWGISIKSVNLQKIILLKTILLFGAGKSATVLIHYLVKESAENQWKFIIADANKEQILSKTGSAAHVEAVEINIHDDEKRAALIQQAHVVISMMPPDLHFLVAKDCVEYRKHLLTASYLDPKIKTLQDEINDRKLLFLCEMGLDPGIDHMSAMKLIDSIKAKGGNINSFKSHCGGLVAPESDDNPWHYKISWNPRNVVLAGKAGAEYKEDAVIVKRSYAQLFEGVNVLEVNELGQLAYYPNRDSLSYIPLYKLSGAHTFIRTTLRYPAFMEGWNLLLQAGLTNDTDAINPAGLSYSEWSEPIKALLTDKNKDMFAFLGLFDDQVVPATANSSADILQSLLENKLKMLPQDHDMIVMLHELEYELEGKTNKLQSTLIVKGENSLDTAMAKTVGLPLGITAKLLLEDKLTLRGLHIPIVKDIYLPVLAELEKLGVCFSEEWV